ncbi:MAG: galactose oxidase early set domain-containing protein [Aquabacterium sp.]
MLFKLLFRIFKAALLLLLSGALIGVIWWHVRNQPVQPAQYHLRGKFGPVTSWPIIPIHIIALPDGRVMSYGTDGRGKQGAQEVYDVWDPKKGWGPESHLLLPNRTGTDLFCSSELIVPSSDSVLVVGGDLTVKGKRNASSADINFYDIKTASMAKAAQKLAKPRWYPTVLTLANSEVLVLGGRLDPTHAAPLPEIYSPTTGWRTLPGADDNILFGSPNWNYPRAWQTPRGDVFVLSRSGQMFSMSTQGQGSFKTYSSRVLHGYHYLPSLMYAPGKILSIRLGGVTNDIDINQDEPIVKTAAWSGLARINAMATVLADGKVYINGGSLINDDKSYPYVVNRLSQIWDPEQDTWLPGAVAAKGRLYHSVALLMQDATVLTGGGGAGDPRAPNNLDVEVYQPPYLFKKDGSGELARRPEIAQAPSYVGWGQKFAVKTTGRIHKFTFVKMGSATHSQVYDQRFMNLRFAEHDGVYTLEAPAKPLEAPPGYYFLFAFDEGGVPSVAKIVRLDTAAS